MSYEENYNNTLLFYIMLQEKIYEELCRIFGDSNRTPTTDDIAEMKYLECCIKESLRLYPSVPFIARFLKEDVELSEYPVSNVRLVLGQVVTTISTGDPV